MASAGVPQQLESLLAAFTNPDNDVRRRAEAAWEDLKQRLPDEVSMYVVEIVAGRNTGITTTAVPLSLHAAPCLAMKHREACWEPGVLLLSRGEGKQDTVAVCVFLASFG